MRVVYVTDASPDALARLRTLLKEKREELLAANGGSAQGQTTICIISGNFLEPTLQTAIDRGRSAVQLLNKVPVNYVTWGTREAELSHEDVLARSREFRNTWLNTNVRSHEAVTLGFQRDFADVVITSANGSNTRRVALLGLLTSEPERPFGSGYFNGAVVEDVALAMAEYKSRLDASGFDLVLPICHTEVEQDESAARVLGFPLLLCGGGADSQPADRSDSSSGCRLLKPGAGQALVLDVTWPSAEDGPPTVNTQMVSLTAYAPDPELAAFSETCRVPLDDLGKAQVVTVPQQFRPLSSANACAGRATFATFLCSALRDALNGQPSSLCDCVIVNGGCMPLLGRNYSEDEHVSFELLQGELKQGANISIVELPGSLLRDSLRETWREENPGWMQSDDGMEVDDEGLVTVIGGELLAPDRIYRVGTVEDFFNSSLAGPSISSYFADEPGRRPKAHVHWPVQTLLMEHWAGQAWSRIWSGSGMYLEQEFGARSVEEGEVTASTALDEDDLRTAAEKDFIDILLKTAAAADSVGGQALIGEHAARRQRSSFLGRILGWPNSMCCGVRPTLVR